MTTEATSAEQPPGGPGALTQLAMTAISLAVLGGLVLRQVRPGSNEARTPVAGSAMQRTVPEGATPTGGQAAATGTVPPTIYLVESQERARAVRADIEEVNAHRADVGLPQLAAQVVWFADPEAEAAFLQGLAWALGVPFLSSLSIIDLRSSAGGSDAAAHQ
jgi:hypothetical protein